ncbi:hypothetical protein RFI_11224, partial [Reticulomyxa filosa]
GFFDNKKLNGNDTMNDEIKMNMLSSRKRNRTELAIDQLKAASQKLLLSEVPEILPCRDVEHHQIQLFMENAIQKGGCTSALCSVLVLFFSFLLFFFEEFVLYCIHSRNSNVKLVLFFFLKKKKDIAGMPGTGKTATCRQIARELQLKVKQHVCNLYLCLCSSRDCTKTNQHSNALSVAFRWNSTDS